MEATASAAGTSSAEQTLIKRILLPTDLTPIGDVALEVALDLARRTDASLDILTVLGPIEGDAYSPVQYSPEASIRHEKAEALIRHELEDLAARHDTRGVHVSMTTRKGRPLSTIVARAEQLYADLIVVGTHERGRLQHFMIGSAAEEIVGRAPCSALVVHEHDERPLEDLKSLLVPIDLSDYSPGLLKYAHHLAQLYDARLEIVHVVEPVPILDVLSGFMTIGDVVTDMKAQISEEVEKRLAPVDFGDVDYDVHIVEGPAASQIVDEAARLQTGVIVIGKQGRSGIERFLMGSVTERVVRHAECPVLVAYTGSPTRQ